MKLIYTWSVWLVAIVVGVLFGARLGLLMGFLLAAIFTDVMNRKIPNKLIVAGIASGFFIHTIFPSGSGFVFAVSGLFLGFFMFLPLYMLRIMGAGDVKLMALVGCFLGAQDVIGAALGTLLAGGVLSLLFSLKLKSTRQLLCNVRLVAILGFSKVMSGKAPVNDGVVESVGTLPYAVAIAVGTAGYLVWHVL